MERESWELLLNLATLCLPASSARVMPSDNEASSLFWLGASMLSEQGCVTGALIAEMAAYSEQTDQMKQEQTVASEAEEP